MNVTNLNYYYLVASLPTLNLNDSKGVDSTYFLHYCAEHISRKDLEVLKKSRISNFSVERSKTVFQQWQRWECEIRNQLVLLRCQQLGRDPESYLRNGNATIIISNPVRFAFEASTPIKSENILQQARWKFLDELEDPHSFDLNYLIIYYLRIQLIERNLKFTVEAGKRVLEKMGVLEESR